MFFHLIARSQRSSDQAIKQTITTTRTTMFSFLNKGDINNTIRAITNLPGLFTSDGNKIKYAALNYATAMRDNLHDGAPIFRHIRTLESEIERRDINSIVSGRIPSAAAKYANTTPIAARAFIDNGDIRRDNATLALIMAKEMAFLNRSIQMISLIARRYQEEQEDLEYGKTYKTEGDLEEGGISGSGSSGGEETPDVYDDDSTPSVSPLQRSSSSPTASSIYNTVHRPENQLVSTFLIATGRLYSRFNNLCRLIETSTVHVHAMTTQDKPHSEANLERQLLAERLVISDIYMFFSKFDAEHRDPVVWAFLELRDISVSVWRIMSMFAFSNMFRLAEGTDFAIYYKPEDAIFTDGRDYRLAISRHEEVAEWRFLHLEEQQQMENHEEEDTETTTPAVTAGLTFKELDELATASFRAGLAAVAEEDAIAYD